MKFFSTLKVWYFPERLNEQLNVQVTHLLTSTMID